VLYQLHRYPDQPLNLPTSTWSQPFQKGISNKQHDTTCEYQPKDQGVYTVKVWRKLTSQDVVSDKLPVAFHFCNFKDFDQRFLAWMSENFTDPDFDFTLDQLYYPANQTRVCDVDSLKAVLDFIYNVNDTKTAYFLLERKPVREIHPNNMDSLVNWNHV
jgi:hypothetical protein